MKKRSQRKEWLSQSKECRAEPAEGFQRRFDEASVPTFMTADKVITAKPLSPPRHHLFTKASSGIPLHPPFKSDKTLEVNFSIWGVLKRAVAVCVTGWEDLFSTILLDGLQGAQCTRPGIVPAKKWQTKRLKTGGWRGWSHVAKGINGRSNMWWCYIWTAPAVIAPEPDFPTYKEKRCAIFQSLGFTTCVGGGRWKKTPIMFSHHFNKYLRRRW